MTHRPGTPLLRMEGISKSFSGHAVLHAVDFEVRAGETHILAGENGAGKSTLMKILGGVHRPDTGRILLHGLEVELSSPEVSRRSGIAMVHQEMSLIESMSVTDNLLLGQDSGLILRGRARDLAARRHCERVGLDLDVKRPVGEFAVAVRTQLEIAKALSRPSSLVIMDEPTASLPQPDVERLLELLKDLKSSGRGIIYISHRMEEIYRIGDRITVLRDGHAVGTAASADLREPKLIQWMVGREVPPAPSASTPARERGTVPALSVRGLSLRGERGYKIQDVSLDLH
ncbi:MAG TPA: ATP-binding cassette domain-containing protein, partial [Bdellovibrionota bacterium]|nr:ATP-binding cassette domain-containing protein [Bdellovibrionota bacterium]